MTNELTTIDPETIKRQFEQAVARREAEERRLADEEKQLHEMTAQIEQRKRNIQSARQSKLDAEATERELRMKSLQAEAMQPTTQPITRETAQLIGQRLLDAFATYGGQQAEIDFDRSEDHRTDRTATAETAAQRFWREIEESERRMLTTDVDDDAADLTLAIDGLLLACFRWLDCAGSKAPNRDLKSDNALLGAAPPDSRHVERFRGALESVMNGGQPSWNPPSVASLIRSGEGSSFEMLCRHLLLVGPDGAASLDALANVIDIAEPPQPTFIHLLFSFGCRTPERAFEIRQSKIDYRLRLRADRIERDHMLDDRGMPVNVSHQY